MEEKIVEATVSNGKDRRNGTESKVKYVLAGVGEAVVGEDVVSAAHREPHTILVVFERIVGHLGVERLQEGHASIPVVVTVVVCGTSKRCDTDKLRPIVSMCRG